MRIALDTNRYSALAKGDQALAVQLEAATVVFLPFVVVAELRAGFAVGARGAANERSLALFLQQPGVSVLWPGEATLVVYAGLYRQLRAQGTPIPTNDLWIGALTIEHGLVLLSDDDHFRHLPQISRR
ncbi:MAG: type II toxin-antitoxin system VapC family toxin [Deltaproteobacteria bacterium]|nr:type II toxin-antitoxin system VapC family toxin [Deltaproteobacteria bacterium]